jgi:hypothetical protein
MAEYTDDTFNLNISILVEVRGIINKVNYTYKIIFFQGKFLIVIVINK